jgi:hypothetical protein
MPPGTTSYVQLPNGSYVQVPTDPAQLALFKTRLQSYLTSHSEAGSVAARPDATKQAQADVRKPLDQAAKSPNPTDQSVFVPTHGYGGGGSYVTGSPKEIGDIKNKQRQVTEAGLAGAGGELVAPLAELAEGVKFLPTFVRAAGAGTGAATGAKVSGASTKEALQTGGEYAGSELAGEAIFGAMSKAYERIFNDPKLTMRQATDMMADHLSTHEISPGEYGKALQDTFTDVKNKAGAEKREFLEGVMRENPDMRVNPRAVNEVLQDNVKNLQFMKERNPELFKEGTAQERTLAILERELRNTQDYNLAMADTRRSQFWNYKQQLDPSMASKIVGDLDRATTQDITNALAKKDPALARQYLEKSARYRELSDIGRADILEKVFGSDRVSPDRVISFLNQAPEESLRAIRTMQRNNPEAVANLRRQLFEQSIKTAGTKGLMKLQPSLIKSIYGPQAESVQQFINMIDRKAATSDNLVTKVAGKPGAVLRILAGKDKPAITVRASEMSKILKSSEILRLFTQAADMPADSPPAAMMRDTLERAMQATGIRSEAEQRTSRVPVWKREGGGGENPPGSAPAPETPPTPPTQGGPSGTYAGPERRQYKPSEKTETLSAKSKDYGKEFNSQEWQEEIQRNERILRDPRATAEDRQIASDRLRDAREGFNRVQSGGKNVPETPAYKVEEKGGTKWAVTSDGVRVSITDKMTPQQIEKALSDQIEMRKKFTADREAEKQ